MVSCFFSNINRDRYAAAKETHQKKLNSLFFLDSCCQNKTDYFITVEHRHEGFLKYGTFKFRCIMYERPLTTMLTIDLEANHRVSKHPSQNITLKPFRRFTGKAPALCHCYFFLSPAFHKYCMKGTLPSFPWNTTKTHFHQMKLWSPSSLLSSPPIYCNFSLKKVKTRKCVSHDENEGGWCYCDSSRTGGARLWATVKRLLFTVQKSGGNNCSWCGFLNQLMAVN